MATAAPQIVPGRYIVTLRPGVRKQIKANHFSLLQSKTQDPQTSFKCQLRDDDYDKFNIAELQGYCAELDEGSRAELEDMDEVASIEPVKLYRHCEVQQDAPWGLARISSRPPLDPQGPYSYEYGRTGKGCTAYVIDTGLNATHEDFQGPEGQSRATRGPTFVSQPGGGEVGDEDTQGHGTHVAGTICGNKYGVAKEAKVIAIKVFNDGPMPGATNEDIIKALEWIVSDAVGKPAVVNMSLGGMGSQVLDSAVAAAVRAGVVCCCAAGNESATADTSSPGREPLAITVGATDISDKQASFSNYGKLVDILAPGVDITSAWIGGNDATNTISGTSMATPHVAGLVCCLLGDTPQNPLEVPSELLIWAEKNRITGLGNRTINALLHNDVDSSDTSTGQPGGGF